MHRNQYLDKTPEQDIINLSVSLQNYQAIALNDYNESLELRKLFSEKNSELVRLKKENTGLNDKIAKLEEKLNSALVNFSNLLGSGGEISRAQVNSLLFLPAKQEVATQTSAPALEL